MKHNRTGYNRGCRCSICTQSKRDYARRYTKEVTNNLSHKDKRCFRAVMIIKLIEEQRLMYGYDGPRPVRSSWPARMLEDVWMIRNSWRN